MGSSGIFIPAIFWSWGVLKVTAPGAWGW